MGNVDTEIHPSATGAAAGVAKVHAAEESLKLYAGWFCPFVQRAWLVLEEKKIPYQYIEINPYHKAPEFLALNPRGLVPTLGVPVDTTGQQQKPLYESTVICEYLDEAYSDEEKYGARLLPEEPYERAWCRLWIDHIGGKIVPAFYKFLQHTPQKEYSIGQAREGLKEHITTFTKEMKDGGPWFLGNRFSLVDIMIAPWAARLWLIEHYKPGGLALPKPGSAEDAEGVWTRWQQWMDAISDRKSVRETLSDKEQYIGVYKRYAEDTTNSMVGQATRRGQKLP